MLREQLKKMERQREEEQLERARIINALTKRLEDSQQQCAKLLQTSESSVSKLSNSNRLPLPMQTNDVHLSHINIRSCSLIQTCLVNIFALIIHNYLHHFLLISCVLFSSCFLQVQCRRWARCKWNYNKFNQPKHWVKTWTKSCRFVYYTPTSPATFIQIPCEHNHIDLLIWPH